MAEVIVRLVGADGVPAFHSWPPLTPLPDGAFRVARWPGPGEDFVDGAWVCNHKAVADAEAGPTHIEEAHSLKYLEALVIHAGIALGTGLLVNEAAAKGVTVAVLADEVLAKRGAFVAKEIDRQLRQSGDAASYTIPASDPLAQPTGVA
jgi:hypothetical protein